ncbi:uncharacterized protein LOC108664760 [Hyalella azteca]|uniref:Uncharacterized protein LOC108664760 n=1 Tax=Hyalella azteca TaxID=294128 RepID=A0A8B7N081_HYAAZ|nr:uncharacterized protein LOC108664760 [Hyalella azteca]
MHSNADLIGVGGGGEGGLMSPSMELAGEQMMARIMATGGIVDRDERRRGSVALGRITPLGRINEDDEERSPASADHSKGDGEDDEGPDHRLCSGLTISEEKMVVIKEGKVIEIESGQVLLEGQKVIDLEEGKMVELADGKVVGLEGGKLLEFEGDNYMSDNYGDDNSKFPVHERYVMGGGEQYSYSRDGSRNNKPMAYMGDKYHGNDGGGVLKHYDNKYRDEESYDNLCKDQYVGAYTEQSLYRHQTEYDQLPYAASYHRPPANFAGPSMGYGPPQNCLSMPRGGQNSSHCSSMTGSLYAPLVANAPPPGGHTTPAQYKSLSGAGPYTSPLPPPAQQYLHISAQRQQQRQQQ